MSNQEQHVAGITRGRAFVLGILLSLMISVVVSGTTAYIRLNHRPPTRPVVVVAAKLPYNLMLIQAYDFCSQYNFDESDRVLQMRRACVNTYMPLKGYERPFTVVPQRGSVPLHLVATTH